MSSAPDPATAVILAALNAAGPDGLTEAAFSQRLADLAAIGAVVKVGEPPRYVLTTHAVGTAATTTAAPAVAESPTANAVLPAAPATAPPPHLPLRGMIRGGMAAVAAAAAVLLVAVDALLWWLWTDVSPAVAVTLGIAMVTGTLAWLRGLRSITVTHFNTRQRPAREAEQSSKAPSPVRVPRTGLDERAVALPPTVGLAAVR